jgi:hypothetical protein
MLYQRLTQIVLVSAWTQTLQNMARFGGHQAAPSKALFSWHGLGTARCCGGRAAQKGVEAIALK